MNPTWCCCRCSCCRTKCTTEGLLVAPVHDFYDPGLRSLTETELYNPRRTQQRSLVESIVCPALFIARGTLHRSIISGRPSIVVFRQHQFLHMSTSYADISPVENRQHHSRIQQIRKWLIGIICSAAACVSGLDVGSKKHGG